MISLAKLYRGIVPTGWTSVFKKQPPLTGVYQSIRQVGKKNPVIDDTKKNRFICQDGLEVWQTGYDITVLAWRK